MKILFDRTETGDVIEKHVDLVFLGDQMTEPNVNIVLWNEWAK